MGGRQAVAFAVSFVLGLFAGRAADATWSGAALACACALGALAAIAPPRTGAMLVLVCACAVGGARGGARQARFEATVAACPADERVVRFDAVCAEPPRREGGEAACVVRVCAGARLPLGARVRLRLPAGATADWGDTVRVLARVERFERVRVPGGFDAREAAAASGVAMHGRAFTCRVRAARGWSHAPVALAMRVRRAVERALSRTLSAPSRELAAPLLFGDRSAMTPETDARLRGSGLVHLLALSGLHVVWLAAVARGVCAWVGGGVAARAWAGAGCAVAYALLAGPLPSLLRAVAGESLASLARLTQRAHDPVQSLAFGAAVLLAWEPGWTGDLGFQLSVAATLGLVTLSRPLAAPFARWPRVHALAQPVTTTLAAQLVALPILLARFHALPWTGLVSNLVAVPISEFLLAAAWLGGGLEALAPGLGRPWLPACEPLAAAVHATARVAAGWPHALPATGSDPAPALLAAAGALLLALAAPAPRTLAARARARPHAAIAAGAGALSCACALLAAATARPLAPPPGTWWLVAIDVGQGDALAVADREGWWLVDAGPRSPRWDAGEGAVLPFLRWAGVRELRALVVTHDDGDHTGGAPAVLRSVRARERLTSAARPGVPGPAHKFGAREVGRGDRLQAAPGAIVLWPPRAGEPGEAVARRGDNAASLVLELGEGGGRALLMADADSLVEEALAPPPRTALLKAGHHGSGSSSGAAFVARTRPRRVIVSAGRRNAYGHPHPLALERLAAYGARLDRTDREGTLWYAFDRDGVRRLAWRRARVFAPARPYLRPAPPPAR